MTKYYCPMPWHGGFFTPTRQAVCCTHSGQNSSFPLEYIKSQHVQDIKNNLISGNLDQDCAACRDKEQQGLFSLKQSFTNMLEHLGVNFCEDPTAETHPVSIEVRMSNLCNFQCRMCGPRDSNLIGRELELFPEIARFFEPYNPGLVQANDYFFDEIVSLLPKIKRIYFTGGEPMIHKQVLKLMDIMIAQGINENVELAMTTNGSAINPYITDQLKQFHRTQLTVSVDGVGAVGDYQRHGSDWNKVSANVKTLGDIAQEIRNSNQNKWMSLSLHSVISVYTVLDVDRLMEYYIDVYQKYRYSINVTIINNYYLNPNVLPNHLRSVAIDKIQKAIHILCPFEHESYIKQVIEQLQRLEEILGQPLNDFHNYKEFVEFTKTLDQARNQDFEKTFGFPLTVDKEIQTL